MAQELNSSHDPPSVFVNMQKTYTYTQVYKDIYIYISANPGWRVGHLGGLTSPFPPPNRGGGPWQAPKKGVP